ncbi:MAG: glycosyltransferase family 1 protein [Mogibacterium sp.]|nr:glycosyltransferase family 1 protein [Mogibacterium sp.]
MKRCIFHYPGPIQENPSSGSAVRPNRMLNAFKAIGYEVEEVTGFSKERAEKIKEVRKKIRNGVKYNFVYSENTSMPTAMADSDHVPRHPVMDEVFLRKCRKAGIPVGLFYRDAYWQFPLYKESVKWFVPMVTIPIYKNELKGYRKCTDVLFVPSNEFAEAIGYKGRYQELPPGGDPISINEDTERTDDRIRIFYVGGVSGLYDITVPVQIISEFPEYRLTVCCAEKDWEANETLKGIVAKIDNISVIHKKKHELGPFYIQADIAMAFFERNAYRDLAMPVKLFEYIGYGKPVIATAGTAAGRYIKDNDIGWAIDFDSEQLRTLLRSLAKDRNIIRTKTDKTIAVAPGNTWEARAQMVVKTLTELKQ